MKPQLTNRRALAALDEASKLFEITPAAIVGSNKKRAVVVPARQALCAALYRATAVTTMDLARFIGGRDHSTIIHHIRRAEDRAKIDPDYAERISRIVLVCK